MDAAEHCPIHSSQLRPKSVRVRYGLVRASLKVAPDYLLAKSERFRFCDDVVLGGCSPPEQRRSTRRMICAECSAERDAWLEAHHPKWVATHETSGL
jgi:hypothetical protein